MSVDQRRWWERGDQARHDDERAGVDTTATCSASRCNEGPCPREELTAALAAYFEADLEGLTVSERDAALEAAEHGHREGRPGGYGRPPWLDAHAGRTTQEQRPLRGGDPCPGCGAPLASFSPSGRGSAACDHCQTVYGEGES